MEYVKKQAKKSLENLVVDRKTISDQISKLKVQASTVGACSSVTRRVLAEIVYVIYYEVWTVLVMEYTAMG